MGQTRFASGRQLDLICLGRLGVDLYAQQVGARLEDVSSFAKYLGGSSANIAFGTARLGLKDRETFPLVFYRENCADMALRAEDISEAFIASSKALLITGTPVSYTHLTLPTILLV